MGGCVSSPTEGGAAVSTEAEKRAHREAERQMKEAKASMQTQVKVLLLGSGDSGKSTILKVSFICHTFAQPPSTRSNSLVSSVLAVC
jgi:guanine nucleotide-binding protein subunit alpha